MPVFSPSQSPIPNVFNFAPQNLKKARTAIAKVKAGISNARFLCVGDSTTLSIGSNGSGSGNMFPLSYPNQLAGLFNAAGINAHANGFAGSGPSGGARDSYDARIALAGSMQQFISPEATYATIGGGLYGATSNTASKLSFTPTVNVDTFKVWYVQLSGSNANFSLDINGGTAANYSCSGTNGVASQTIVGTLASNTLNIKWLSGNQGLFIIGVEAWDSSKKWVSFINAGWGGSASTDWVINTIFYNPVNINALSPDLTLINLGINDWNNSTSIATYTANIQALITVGLSTGDVVLVSPNPSNPSGYAAQATQQTYIAALYNLAQSNGIVLIDDFTRLVSYASVSSLGLNYDSLHLNGAGYADKARSTMNVIGSA